MLKKILQIALLLLSLQTARAQSTDSSKIQLGIQVFQIPGFPALVNENFLFGAGFGEKYRQTNGGLALEGLFSLSPKWKLRTVVGVGMMRGTFTDTSGSNVTRTEGVFKTRQNSVLVAVGVVQQVRWGKIGLTLGPQLMYVGSSIQESSDFQPRSLPEPPNWYTFEYQSAKSPFAHGLALGFTMGLDCWLSKNLVISPQISPLYGFSFFNGKTEVETKRTRFVNGTVQTTTTQTTQNLDHQSAGFLPLLPAISIRFNL